MVNHRPGVRGRVVAGWVSLIACLAVCVAACDPVSLSDRVSRAPDPFDAAADTLRSENLQSALANLSYRERRVLELRLQDCTLDEIAAETGRCERTVRRWLDSIKTRLAERLKE